MIDTCVLPVFLAAVAVLLVVPGPNFVLISSQSIARGAGYGVACSVGIFLAGIFQTTLVALGLGNGVACCRYWRWRTTCCCP